MDTTFDRLVPSITGEERRWPRLVYDSLRDGYAAFAPRAGRRRGHSLARLLLMERIKVREDVARGWLLSQPPYAAALAERRATMLHHAAEFLFYRGCDDAKARKHLEAARQARRAMGKG